ncbi:agmatine deiminase family protein, partial [bacterium]|nr:agmatine deiminase family protein [bacterium]
MKINFLPSEWSPHQGCFLAWPYIEEWGQYIDGAQEELTELVRNIAGSKETPNEKVYLLCAVPEEKRLLENEFRDDSNVQIVSEEYGDIWLRDTAPVFGFNDKGLIAGVFKFNGWGKKYFFDEDIGLSSRLAKFLGAEPTLTDFVCEGGALEHNGAGVFVTTRSCLLNKNRNPGMSEEQVEAALRALFPVEKLIWLEEGLEGDHTDGHVDTLFRFVSENVCLIANARTAPLRNQKA